MATFEDLWHKLLRAFRLNAFAGPTWVEPSNAVTRAIYEGSAFVTMPSWEELAPLAAGPPISAPLLSPGPASTGEAPAAEDSPARRGVAA